MKTSYFWKATHEPEPDTCYVSISRQTQKGATHIKSYPDLFPNWDIIKLAHASNYSPQSFELYRKKYYEQLDRLNPNKVYEDLKDCTLICFESPRDLATGTKYCHRRMVAGWIEERLGILIPEELRVKDSTLIVPAIYRT